MLRVQEIRSIDELATHRDAWRQLLTVTPGATFFHSWEWLEVYWRHFGAAQKLRALLVYDTDALIGILPLTVLPERHRVGTLRVLTYPLASWGSFYGPIGRDSAAILQAGWRHIGTTRRDWDLAEPRFVDPADASAHLTQAALHDAGMPTVESTWDSTAIIDLDDSYEGYLASKTSKWRNNFKRWQRRLAERGEVNYLRYRPAGEDGGECDPRWDLYEACEAIARQSWQGSSQNGTTLSHESVRGFLRDVHATAAALGALDLNLLLLDGQPLAFAYNYHYRGRIFGLRIGCNAELANDGVGNLLYMHAIRDSYDRGDKLYDLGPGSLDAKKHLLTRVAAIQRYTHYRAGSPRAQLLRLKRWAVREWQVRQAARAKAQQPAELVDDTSGVKAG